MLACLAREAIGPVPVCGWGRSAVSVGEQITPQADDVFIFSNTAVHVLFVWSPCGDRFVLVCGMKPSGRECTGDRRAPPPPFKLSFTWGAGPVLEINHFDRIHQCPAGENWPVGGGNRDAVVTDKRAGVRVLVVCPTAPPRPGCTVAFAAIRTVILRFPPHRCFLDPHIGASSPLARPSNATNACLPQPSCRASQLALQMVGNMKSPISRKNRARSWEEIRRLVVDLRQEAGIGCST